MAGDYQLRSDGQTLATLRIRGLRSRGVADLGGERYSFRASGFIRRRIMVTADATGEEVARIEGKRVLLADGRELRREKKAI